MRHLIASAAALAAAAALLALTPGHSLAQTSPGLYNGQVPTAGEWNLLFAAKQDYNAGYFGQPYTWTAPQTWTAQASFGAHISMNPASPAPPVVTSCGSGPTVVGSDTAGEVTSGTGSPTSCTITFHTAFLTQPYCLVQDRSAIANLTSFTVSASAIVVTNTAASSQKLVYHCFGL
jgi:hypothetical protein